MREEILDMLADICEDDIVKEDLNVDLFETGLLDSLGFVELMVEVEDRFGIPISPTEIEREEVSTPEKVIAYIEGKK